MQKEKITAIFLVLIIVGALFVYIATKEDLFGSETDETGTIELGDCVDVYYIGKFANGTIFDSSYEDPENKIGGIPLNIYVSKDMNAESPSGYEDYIAGMIEGFIDGIIDLKEGQETTIGPIPPEKAYGYKVKSGETFNTINVMMNEEDPTESMSITVEVTNINSEYIDLRWINVEDFDKFTMPNGILNDLTSLDYDEWVIRVPPYYLWKNSTEIIEVKEDSVIVKTTPTKTENITDEIFLIQYGDITTAAFPDATTITYDDEVITIHNDPEIGTDYEFVINYGFEMITTITVEDINITKDTINISLTYEGSEKEYHELNKTVSFDRLYTINRNFSGIPLYYANMLFGEELLQKDLSFIEIAGETLYFDVVIEKVYKTSES